MKKKYCPLECRVISFECETVLAPSGFPGEDDDFTRTVTIQSENAEKIQTKVNPT